MGIGTAFGWDGERIARITMRSSWYIPALTILTAPLLVLAAPKTFQELVYRAVYIINLIIPIIIGMTVVVYMYGAASGILATNSDGKKRREHLKTFYGTGILILFVMVSVWGILALLKNTLSVALGSSGAPTVTTECQFGSCE